MYELAPEECRRRVAALEEILDEQNRRGSDPACQCAVSASAAQGGLLARTRAGDASGFDELLGYYRRCIDAWARDICPTAAARSCFKAELAATLLGRVSGLTDENFNHQLHVTATQVAISQHRHVLEWHRERNGQLSITHPIGATAGRPQYAD